MKKTYINPELEVIDLKMGTSLLADSVKMPGTDATDDPGNPGYYIDL